MSSHPVHVLTPKGARPARLIHADGDLVAVIAQLDAGNTDREAWSLQAFFPGEVENRSFTDEGEAHAWIASTLENGPGKWWNWSQWRTAAEQKSAPLGARR